MTYYPRSVQNALDNRIALGKEAASEYWRRNMDTRQRNSVDCWIMKNRIDILNRCGIGPQMWRFTYLIEVLYAEHNKEKADEEAAS